MEGILRFKIDQASLQLEGDLLFFLGLTLYSRTLFSSTIQAPGGLYSEGLLKKTFFARVTGLRGLYLEGLIHGGAYFRNFMVQGGPKTSVCPCNCMVANYLTAWSNGINGSISNYLSDNVNYLNLQLVYLFICVQ